MQISEDWPAEAEAIRKDDLAGLQALLDQGKRSSGVKEREPYSSCTHLDKVEVKGKKILDQRRKGRGFGLLEYAVYLNRVAMIPLLKEAGNGYGREEIYNVFFFLLFIFCFSSSSSLCTGADLEAEFQYRGTTYTVVSYCEARQKTAALAALQQLPQKQKREKPPATLKLRSTSTPGSPVPVPRPMPRKALSPRPSKKDTSSIIKYEELALTRELGKGSFGTVWRGTWRGREVACKVMSSVKEEKEQEQLRREIQLHSKSKHENIVEMFGLTKDPEKNLVLVLELVDGGDLLTLLKASQTELPWAVRLRMLKETAAAMAFLHNLKILHRDLVRSFVVFSCLDFC
jgi:hypothetical protein